MKRYPVVIVGGGPAGASCARSLVAAGLDPLVIDREVFPRQKVCAGWITPAVFDDLGVAPASYPHALTEFPRLQIHLGGIPFNLPGKQYAIRRMEFDSWLLGMSRAELMHHEVKEIQRGERGYVLDGLLEAEILVGAGGTHCPVYRSFRENSGPRRGTRIVALESEYRVDWGEPTCRLWFLENKLPGYSWYVPKREGYLNIGVGGSAEGLRERESTIQDQWEYLVEKLLRRGWIAERPPAPRGYVYHLRGSDQPLAEDSLYLVGDAAGLATLDMGEGIGPAIRSGQLAAEAILGRGPCSWAGIPRYSLLPRGLRWLVR